MFFKTFGLVAVLLVAGCKLERQKEREHSDTPGYRTGDTLRPARDLNSNEVIMGKRVCRDLRYKRNQWEVATSSMNFNFNVSARTQCSGGLMNYGVNAHLDNTGGDLIFSSTTTSPFLNEVLTDLHPAIQGICDDLLTDQPSISNTVEISGTRYQVSFYEYLSTHFVLMSRFIQDADGAWRAAVIDEAGVIVHERTTDTSLLGVVKRRVRESRCTGGQGSKIVQQEMRQIF